LGGWGVCVFVHHFCRRPDQRYQFLSLGGEDRAGRERKIPGEIRGGVESNVRDVAWGAHSNIFPAQKRSERIQVLKQRKKEKKKTHK